VPVFTSSYDRQIPHGLLVGYVKEVDDHDRDRVERVTLRPGIALGRLAQVWVIPIERPRQRR
jgi:cell shape-determining protein MreC